MPAEFEAFVNEEVAAMNAESVRMKMKVSQLHKTSKTKAHYKRTKVKLEQLKKDLKDHCKANPHVTSKVSDNYAPNTVSSVILFLPFIF